MFLVYDETGLSVFLSPGDNYLAYRHIKPTSLSKNTVIVLAGSTTKTIEIGRLTHTLRFETKDPWVHLEGHVDKQLFYAYSRPLKRFDPTFHSFDLPEGPAIEFKLPPPLTYWDHLLL